MKDIKGYKTLKNKELKLKQLNLKKERLAKNIARLDFDDYDRIIKKGKQLKEIEAQIEEISEELEKYVSLENLNEDKNEDEEKNIEIPEEAEKIENEENDIEEYDEDELQDFEEFKAEKITSLREILKDDDELDNDIDNSIKNEDIKTEELENKNEHKASSTRQRIDKKTKKIKENADLRINKIQTIINKDKEKRKVYEEKLEELKDNGVIKAIAVKIAEKENNENAINKFKEELEILKQQVMEIETELHTIQSQIMMNQLRQSSIRMDAIEKIEIVQAVDSLNKSAMGKAWIYTKAAAIAVVRSAKETINKIKDKINKKDNKLKLNSGNEENTKIYEPKIKKENQIKNRYSQNIDYTSAYNNINHHKETDEKDLTEDYRE